MRFEIKQEKQAEAKKPTTLELVHGADDVIWVVASNGIDECTLIQIYHDGTFVRPKIRSEDAGKLGIRRDKVGEFQESAVSSRD